MKGTVVQFVEYNSRIYKVVYEKDDIFWLISFENPAAPFPASKENLILQEMPAEYMDETPASAKRNTTMEKRLKILDEMVYDDRCCHDVAHRNRVVKKIAKDNGLSEKTILRWYYAYLAKGKRGLLPAARIHEIVEAPEEAGMKRAISRYYYSPVKMSLRGAYEMYLMDECRTEDGRLQDERPPFSKFKSVYNKMRSDYRKIISRQGIGEFQKNYRPLLGQAVDVAPLCGHFEMDATSADIELVSKYSRQSVGRPYVYLVVDVFSRLIAGFYVDFNTNTDAVLMCIRSLLQDKVEIARKRGVTIAPDAWPTTGLPCEITFDKGKDFMGERTKELCELFNIEITNLPAYRPDLKGCVERAFGEVQGMYMNLLHGHGTYEKVNTRLGLNSMHSTPCLDIDEYINILMYCIADYNSSAIVKAFGDTTTMPDGTPVTTVDQLYDYYIESETMTNTQNAIIAYLQENSEVSEIPESIVEQQKEVERQYAEYIASVYNYESVDEFLAANDYEDMDAYIDTAMDSIESNVKYRLIIQAIAEADGLEVENDAYVKAFGATKDIVAATYGEEYAAQMALEYTVLTHLILTNKKAEYINLQNAATEMARSILGNPDWDTRCEY